MDKTKNKSKSMEEISAINSGLARTHATRLSLPAHQDHTKKRIHPVVLDVERIEEEEDDNPVRIDAAQNARGSQMSKKSHRSRAGSNSSKSSRVQKDSVGSKHRREYAYENRAYDNNLDEISVISRASTRASSVQSLEVQREQYCCFTKWSPFERKLAALVAVLITIILMLIIAVVVLASRHSEADANQASLSS
ncbi:hypothetical protein Trydic_g20610 [Trypoxylus dichotomus]